MMKKMKSLGLLLGTLASACCLAAPVNYKIDPNHTFPSFEADHMGISVWRGKMNKSSGRVVYDKETGAGSVDIAIDPASIDFGQDALNAWGRGEHFFNVRKCPRAAFKGHFEGFADGVPSQLVGELTLHCLTRPVSLKINSLKCIAHPMYKREMCGADAAATFKRDEFGLDAGKDYGFKMDVDLRIQVEALAEK